LSDITKKIFSIEPADEPVISDIIRPLGEPKPPKEKLSDQDDVPSFVTREPKTPVILATSEVTEIKSGWIIWTGVFFTLLWLAGAALLFSDKILGQQTELLNITGFVLLLALPAVLITLFWISLRRLVAVTNQNTRLANAAHALVTPDTEALGRTQSLANGIRAEITKVNEQLSETVSRLKTVQSDITQESQALDAAGLHLTSRSDDVGRNLTLQRQALESISGTFEAKMETLSSQIEETGKNLETASETAKTRLETAISALSETTSGLSQSTEATEQTLSEKITQLGDISRKIDEVSDALKADLSDSADALKATETTLEQRSEVIENINLSLQEKFDSLLASLASGQEVLQKLESTSSSRGEDISRYYQTLTSRLKQSEDDTLAAQGRTARMVEGNLAQMRREFSTMETDLKALQSRINSLRETHEELPFENPTISRLSLKPLETDFPPVEPDRAEPALRPSFQFDEPKFADEVPAEPLNLGADMQIDNADDDLTSFDPDVLRRPGDVEPAKKGFGRANEAKGKTSSWRWRDMLGGLERPGVDTQTQRQAPKDSINILEHLENIQLSPAAIIDEGTIIDATQARINSGETGLVDIVSRKLADPISHLQHNMARDANLAANVAQFTSDFAERIGTTPPTAPALRTVFGSPNGRAYLLCLGAIKR